MKVFKGHTFHIPVMGLGFTIDTPVKVAHYGISSVISIGDDGLIERMRKLYCTRMGLPFQAISHKMEDHRAKRITSYLNLIDKIVKEKFEQLKKSFLTREGDFEKYMDMLPDFSQLKQKFSQIEESKTPKEIYQWLQDHLALGEIDVNIMTKADKPNYSKGEMLPVQFNDAHASLRGFAESTLHSSVVLSAGMNPRLYGFLEGFQDFFPDGSGRFIKKITLKVSDYRSALIQGKFLAKKGLWVSEYRVESGLNCGGHAFATDGYLLGPVLEEFKNNRKDLVQTLFDLYAEALKKKGLYCPENPPDIRITAQGGVGTAEEHQFLLDYYELDSIGWGTPFLLVPEVTNVDPETLDRLSKAKEEDLYLSNISPLGVPFNNLRNNSKDLEKQELIAKSRPGSPCPNKFLSFNTDYSDKGLCLASRQYQNIKIKELNAAGLNQTEYKKEYDKIVEKACLCVGLGTSVLKVNGMERKVEGNAVSICPGPNMAYFSEVVSLRQMADHIYGKLNLIKRTDRPNLFVKELGMYVDYFKKMIDDLPLPANNRQMNNLATFRENLNEGIEYYKRLALNPTLGFDDSGSFIDDLEKASWELGQVKLDKESFAMPLAK